MARPRKVIDWQKVDEMLMAQCDGTDVAEALGVNPETLYDACQRDHKIGFSDYSQQKRAKGVSHAKTTFFKQAFLDLDADPKAQSTKQIFWLKNYAGMADKVESKQEISATVVKEVVQVELPSNQPDADTPKPWQTDPVS